MLHEESMSQCRVSVVDKSRSKGTALVIERDRELGQGCQKALGCVSGVGLAGLADGF